MEEASPPRSRLLTFFIGFGIGTFVGVALALVATSFVKDANSTKTTTDASVDPAPTTRASVSPTADLRLRTKTALDVRLGPGTAFGVIGLISKGEAIEPVGRDNDAAWVAIRFPPGSTGRGWLPVSGLESVSGVEKLAVVLPTPLPRTIATFPAGDNAFGDGSDGAAASVTPSSLTPQVNSGLPDLVVTRMTLLADGRISVTVGNRGPGDLINQPLFVQVRSLAGQGELLISPVITLKVGGTLTLQSQTFRVTSEEEIQAIVDPFGSVRENDRSNNLLQSVLAPLRLATSTVVPDASP